MSDTAPRRSAWLFYTLLAIVLWGIWGLVSKAAEKYLAPAATQVISTIGVLPTTLLLLASPNLRKGKGFLVGSLAALGVGLTASVGNLALLLSLDQGGEASTVFPLTGMFPLVTILLAVPILHERINWVQCVGLGIACVAFYLFGLYYAGDAGPAASSWWHRIASPWMAYALVALVLWGVAAVLQKVATNHISTELSTVLFGLAFIPVAIVLIIKPIGKPIEWHSISGAGWGIAILFGALIGIGGLVLFAAYRTGKASIVTALYSLYPAITVLLAIPIFEEHFDLRKGIAIVLALAAGVALSYEKPASPAAA